jgi:sn-glycerol 3-phosphate transport system permease protein
VTWDYKLRDDQAMLVVILAGAWKQVSYDFIFFLAGLQSIPRAVVEAARIDGAGAWHRFRTITLPLLTPTIFFLLVVNLVYAAFETFGTIQALTGGGPGKATETLIVKVYRDGVVNLDLGSSSAQSTVLMVAVILLTALQFRFMGRRGAD